MVFVTYVSSYTVKKYLQLIISQYDLRAAERARDRLQGSEISGRPVCCSFFLKSNRMFLPWLRLMFITPYHVMIRRVQKEKETR